MIALLLLVALGQTPGAADLFDASNPRDLTRITGSAFGPPETTAWTPKIITVPAPKPVEPKPVAPPRVSETIWVPAWNQHVTGWKRADGGWDVVRDGVTEVLQPLPAQAPVPVRAPPPARYYQPWAPMQAINCPPGRS